MIPLIVHHEIECGDRVDSITWAAFAELHPFCPADQAKGTRAMLAELEADLAEISLPVFRCSLNSGASRELCGLDGHRAYHASRGDGHRNICLIPNSAHGTNPASAVMAGMKVVVVGCDKHGNIDVDDLREKAEAPRQPWGPDDHIPFNPLRCSNLRCWRSRN